MLNKIKVFLKSNIYLVLIILLFLVTRLYKIDSIPASVYWDEASIGYNAYSILKTGKDEWGEFLPLHFRAFGEFKLPVYVYSVAVLVKMFGLNEITLRLPAVLYGLGSVIVLYLLVYQITKNKLTSTLTSFIFAITPWFYIFTRTGYEVTAGLFFYLVGIYLLYLGLIKKQIFYLLGVISLLVSLYSYTSFRITAPLTLFVFLIFQLISKNKFKVFTVIISAIIFTIGLIPVVKLFVYDAGFGRAQTFALIPGFQQVYDLQGKPHFQVTFNREGINWFNNVYQIGKNYLSHFSFDFLFINGDSNSRSQMQGWGQLFLVSLPFIVYGLFVLKSKKYNYLWIILLTLVLAPIPAAITKESPHALRAILLIPPLSFLASVGVSEIYEKIKLKRKKDIFLVTVVLIYLSSFAFYFLNFVSNYNNQAKDDWQYQYKEIFEKQKEGCIEDKYGQPYIFALFYGAKEGRIETEPIEFWNTKKLNSVSDWGFSTVEGFANYKFLKKCNN